jgi:hypothetical protein
LLVCGSTHCPAHATSVLGHETAHVPAVQTRPDPHALPQSPQFAGSVWVLAQIAPHSFCADGHAAPSIDGDASGADPTGGGLPMHAGTVAMSAKSPSAPAAPIVFASRMRPSS